MIPHEHTLAGSFYGKFFARKLNLHLLQRNVEAWKDLQSSAKIQVSAPTASQPIDSVPPVPTPTKAQVISPTGDAVEGEKRKRKRKAQPDDEIDALFENALGKKTQKADLTRKDKPDEPSKAIGKTTDDKITDKSLLDVLGAIRAAPKDAKGSRKKRAR